MFRSVKPKIITTNIYYKKCISRKKFKILRQMENLKCSN